MKDNKIYNFLTIQIIFFSHEFFHFFKLFQLINNSKLIYFKKKKNVYFNQIQIDERIILPSSFTAIIASLSLE